MAQIVINEISQNYTYNIGTNSFATVALPITSCWGPAYVDPITLGDDATIDDVLEATTWETFPATQAGLESFVATYRGPASNYRLAKDYSYYMAMSLLTAGYDVLVCRVCPGTCAQGAFSMTTSGATASFTIKAKYPGTFGDMLKVTLNKVPNREYWNLVVYVVDTTGIQTAVENLVFVFEESNSSDAIPHIDEIESKFLTFITDPGITDNSLVVTTTEGGDTPTTPFIELKGGSDTDESTPGAEGSTSTEVYSLTKAEPSDWADNYVQYYTRSISGETYTYTAVSGSTAPTWESGKYYKKYDSEASAILGDAYQLACVRYTSTDNRLGAGYSASSEYLTTLSELSIADTNKANTIRHLEWLYNAAHVVYNLLQDKLNYNPQRIISPGWDDQNICALDDGAPTRLGVISPLHKKIMETAYYSRCATGMIDIPRSCARANVYDETESSLGYAQLLSRIGVQTGGSDVNAVLYNTHSALFAPWGSYTYVGTGKQAIAPPSFLALLIQRAMILNQALQYEWALPTNRKHNLKLGKLDYKVPKKLLDVWQKLEGVGVNVITTIPELGTSLWGNSTLYEVPPATYQALANLSTRYLVNAVENVAYKCGLAITFQYNNEQAYNKFYAGVTPTLDTMKNVGAIDDYYVKMAADINGLDQVNANSVIGKIYLVVNGVINDITIDLIALPPGVDLNQYKS